MCIIILSNIDIQQNKMCITRLGTTAFTIILYSVLHFLIIILNVDMLSVVMMNVVKLSVVPNEKFMKRF